MPLRFPEPYDFDISTERFRAFGINHANRWHEVARHLARLPTARPVGDIALRKAALDLYGVTEHELGPKLAPF